MTVDWDALRAFERDQRRRGLAVRTIRGRTYVIGQFERWMAPVPLTAAHTDHIERWLDSRVLRTNRARATYTGTLRAFYEFAARVGMVEKNPMSDIGPVRTGRLLPNPCTDDEVATALDAAPAGSRERAWVALGAFAGFRTCEMARLAREDVRDHDERPMLFVHGKGEADRIVPVHPEVAAALRSYGLPTRGVVFTTPRDGRPFREETLNAYLNRWLHTQGLDFSAHQLRHWFGTNVNLASGGDLRLTQELMGHVDPGSTAGYTAWDKARAAEIVRRLSTNGYPSPDAQRPPDREGQGDEGQARR